MKSDVVKVTNSGEGMETALQSTSNAAEYRSLAKKDAMQHDVLPIEKL